MKFGAVVRLISESIPLKEGDEIKDDKELRASKILGIQTSETDGAFVVTVGSNLDKFLKEKGIVIEKDYQMGDNIEELIGTPVIIQKTEDGYLEIA